MYINDLKQEILKCVRCGYCRKAEKHEICPIRSVLGFESSYARGKLNIARLYLENKIQISPEIIKIFYLCSLCGNCLKHCPVKIDIPGIINELRYEFLEKYDPFYDPIIIKNFIANLCYNSRTIKKTIKNFITQKGFIGIKPRIYLLDNYDYLFFSGCATEFNKETLMSVFKIFKYLGIKINRLKEEVRCCKLPLSRLGHKNLSFSMASHNISIFNKLKPEKIIFDCPGCLYVFRELYPKYNSEFIHITEFLNDQLTFLQPANELKVTYHDPCLLGRYCGIYEAPRQLLSKMGVTLIEMLRTKDTSFCCGGDTLSIMFPDISKRISKIRIAEAKATGSSILLTSCHGCKLNLTKENEYDMKILDITEFIGEMLDGREKFDKEVKKRTHRQEITPLYA